jgi:hypothetical protein
MMKALIAATLASGLVFAASPTFAQTPPPAGFPPPSTTPATPPTPGTPPPGFNNGSANHPEGKGGAHEKWEDCMARQEAKYGGVKTVGQHAGGNAGGGKGNWKANSKGKPEPPNEKTEAKQGEKENRHQAEMNDCREQLYGRDTPPAGKK